MSEISLPRSLPIGLFDSGVGGMTVLRALRGLLPTEAFIYLGDTARLPYGTKSQETVARYAMQATAKLVERKIKLLVVACNTATASALPRLRQTYPGLSVIGVVEPGAEAACLASVSGKIAVIGTESTINGRAYEEAILNRRPKARIIGKACPLLVPLAEEGLIEGPLAEGIAAHYLDEIFRLPREQGLAVPDCLVLGCTHFPLLSLAIAKVAGQGVTLVDSAVTTAQTVANVLREQNLLGSDSHGQVHFLTTDDVSKFVKLGQRFLGLPLNPSHVELVDL